jgi:hypothetical protein
MILKRIVAAAASVALMFGLAACSDDQYIDEGGEADAICVRASDHVRVDDSQCDSGNNSNLILWYLLATQTAPRYGYPAQYGQPTVPYGYHVYTHRVARTGGTVTAKAPVKVKATTPAQKKETSKFPQYNPNKKSGVPDSKPKQYNKPNTGGGYKPPASKPYSPPKTGRR